MSLDQQVPARGQAPCIEGFKLQRKERTGALGRWPPPPLVPPCPGAAQGVLLAGTLPSEQRSSHDEVAGVLHPVLPQRGGLVGRQLCGPAAQLTWGAPSGPAPFSPSPGLTYLQCHLSSFCWWAERVGGYRQAGWAGELEPHPGQGWPDERTLPFPAPLPPPSSAFSPPPPAGPPFMHQGKGDPQPAPHPHFLRGLSGSQTSLLGILQTPRKAASPWFLQEGCG